MLPRKDALISCVANRDVDRLRAQFDGIDPSRGIAAAIRDRVDTCWAWIEENVGLQFAVLELGMWRIRWVGGENLYDMYAGSAPSC